MRPLLAVGTGIGHPVRMPAVAPVLLLGWREGDEPNAWNFTHHRRLAWVRDQLAEQLRANGVSCTVTLLSNDPAATLTFESTLLRLAEEASPRVVVVCEWEIHAGQLEQLVMLHRQGVIRAAMLSTTDAQHELPTIGYDQVGAGAEAARHGITAGFLRLLYCAPYGAEWSRARAAGIMAVAEEAGVAAYCAVPDSASDPDHPMYQKSEAAARTVLVRNAVTRGITALGAQGSESSIVIIACNDRMALDVRLMLPDFPGGLMGFDDEPLAATNNITSVRPPLAEMARRASELVLRLAQGLDIPHRTALSWELVLRNSTRRQRSSSTHQPRIEASAVTQTPVHGAVIQAPPTVALIYRGAWPTPSPGEKLHAARLERIRLSFLATTARAGVTLSEFPIEFIHPDSQQRLEHAVSRILASGVQVVVIQEFEGATPIAPLFAKAQATGQVQLLFCETVGVPVDQFGIVHDQGAAGSLAATHCLRQGFRRLLFLNPFIGMWGRDRALSARRALLLSSCGQSALVVAPEQPSVDLVTYSRSTAAQREAIVGPMLDEGLKRLAATPAEKSLPAVLAVTDLVALDLMNIITRRGLRLGADLGLMGFDDTPEAAAAGLTSVAPPLETMGQETGRLVLRLLRGEQISKRTCLPWTLVPRTSSIKL